MDITVEPLTMCNTSCGNKSCSTNAPLLSCQPYQSDTDITKGVKIFCYCVLLLVSVLGNSLLVVIIKKNNRMQTITNYLIADMAVSDTLMTVLAVPQKITEILLGPRRWLIDGQLGSALCKIVHFAQDITTGVSILSLVVISIDRYRGLVFPLRRKITNPAKLCRIIIPAIWFVSMGLHLIYFYLFQIETVDAKTYCAPSWAPKFDERKSQEVYFVIILVCLIAIPTCVVTLLYSVVILNLKKTANARCKGGPSSCMTSRRLKEDRDVLRIIITILIAFVVCLTPINVYGILFYFVWDWNMPCGMENYGFAAFFILYSNASVNPCIYFILNDKYRKGLLNILKVFHIVRNRAAKPEKDVSLETIKPTGV